MLLIFFILIIKNIYKYFANYLSCNSHKFNGIFLFQLQMYFQITGIILLSIGSLVHGVFYNYEHFLDSRYFSVPSLLIVVGSIIFFIAFFGCCGAVRENYCMIITVRII